MGPNSKTHIRAHFDGRFIVPDEPLELPPGTALSIEFSSTPLMEGDASADVRLAALKAIFARPVSGAPIPDEALRRENMYEDR